MFYLLKRDYKSKTLNLTPSLLPLVSKTEGINSCKFRVIPHNGVNAFARTSDCRRILAYSRKFLEAPGTFSPDG